MLVSLPPRHGYGGINADAWQAMGVIQLKAGIAAPATDGNLIRQRMITEQRRMAHG